VGRQVGIAAADRPETGLLLAHLAGGAGDPALAIEHKQVAVASHQLQHQAPADRIAGPRRELQLHHPLHGLLTQPHQGQAGEAMLHLLGQGAAIAPAGGGAIARSRGASACQLSSSQWRPLRLRKPSCRVWPSLCWAFSNRLGTSQGRSSANTARRVVRSMAWSDALIRG
jgi:hypothetical protein